MSNSRFESGCQASNEDFQSSIKIPTFAESGMSHIGYYELIKDPKENKKALEDIITEYESSFAIDDALDLLLGPEPKKDSDLLQPSDAIWFDRKNLERLIHNAKELIGGNHTIENLQFAWLLIAAYHHKNQKHIDEVFSTIESTSVQANKTRSLIRKLRIETTEPETLEEISEKLNDLEGYLKVTDYNKRLLYEYISNLKTCLQAARFLTNTSH